MTVLAFVEASEYRKELARQLARNLVSDIGIGGLLDGGDQAAADLIAVLGEELDGLARQALRDALAHAEANGLDAVGAAEAQATLRGALDRVFLAARQQLAARLSDLDSTVARMLASTGEATVRASLSSTGTVEALLAPITSVMTSAAAGAVQAIEGDIASEAVAMTHEQASQDGGGPPLFEWQTRQDGKECDDLFENSCLPRHGKQLTLEEWQAFGEPQNPDAPTICAIFAKNPGASNCRCNLLPADSAASTPEPVNIADAAKAGRDRALKEAA